MKKALFAMLATVAVACATAALLAHLRQREAGRQAERDAAVMGEQMDELRKVRDVAFSVNEENLSNLVVQMAGAVGLDYGRFVERYYIYTGDVFVADGVMFARHRDPVGGTMAVMLGDGTITNLPLRDPRLPR